MYSVYDEPVLIAFTSCTKRSEVLERTLKSFSGTDWPKNTGLGTPLYFDHQAIEHRGLEQEHPRKRGVMAYHLALTEFYNSHMPWLLLCEDDVIFNKHLYFNVQEIIADLNRRNEHEAIVTLYNPAPGYPLYTPKISLIDGSKAYGTQAVLFSHTAVGLCLLGWPRTENRNKGRDMRVFSMCPVVYVSNPSLVDHQQEPSTMNNIQHKSFDFNPDVKI